MAIYQNSNGQWGVDWRDEFGRRHRRQVGSREAALAVERKLRDEAKTRPAPTPATLSLTEAVELYIKSHHFSARTRETYWYTMRQIADQRLDKLSQRDLTEWHNRNLAAYGPNTANLRVGMIKRLFRWLATNAYSPDLAQHLDPPRKVHGKFHILTYEEEAKILAAANDKIKLRVLLALDAGMAIQDACHARRSHWNAEKGLILYRRHKTNANATVPTTRRLQEALEPLKDLPPGAFLTATKDLKRNTDALSNLRERTGIQFLSHDLRRTFATRLAEAETNPLVVAALLGHRTPWEVQLAYVHPTEEMLRRAIERMERNNPNCAEFYANAPPAPPPDPPTPPSAEEHPRIHKRIDRMLHIG